MRNRKVVLAVLVVFSLLAVPLFAQVQSVTDVEMPAPQFQDHGGVTPWFWIGVQTVFSGGYNLETTARGFRNYGGDNYTYASFNLAFVDSHYQTPKFYEVPRELDPDAWTGHFVMLNFTTRINSWEQGTTGVENNGPAWLAEITGKGFRVGFFTQAGNLVGGLYDYGNGSDEQNRKPVIKISGGNKVINLTDSNQLGKLYYEKSDDSTTVTTYSAKSASEGGVWYTGYEQKDLWNVYLTMLSEGSVQSDVSNDTNKGIAGVVDFGVTPFGVIADEETPLTFGVSGNAIGGFGWKGTKENVGFGLKTDVAYYLGNDMVIAPIAAFDGKLDVDNNFFWKAGGGLTFQFSGMRWVHDDWGDLQNDGSPGGSLQKFSFADYRYENNMILKYAYVQVYGAYSDDKAFNMLFRAEEPDGNIGFHDKLGAMIEARLYNITGKDKDGKDKDMSWEAQGRVSWDVNVGQYLITPYLRGYYNSDEVVKARVGAYASFIPFTGFEIAYTSANLNKDSKVKPPAINKSMYKTNFDAGRIELIVILKSDDIKPQVPKRMSDWNYPTEVQHF
jgi:hypothetical protein